MSKKNSLDMTTKNLQIDSDSDHNSNSNLEDSLKNLITIHGIYEIESMLDKFKLSDEDLKEPILNPDNQKFTAFPINYPNIWALYKEQEASIWTADEIDFSGDYDDYLSLNKDEQHFIEMILAFFAASDGIVNFNLSERFTRDVKITEAQFAYQFQMMMENVHSETYSKMLDNIIKNDPEKKEFLFNAVTTVPAVKLMADWSFKWIKSSKSFAHRVIAFTIVEQVFFSGLFAAIFWFKKYKSNGKNFLVGLMKSNKLISRDEGLHCKFGCEMYSLLENKLPSKEVSEMIIEGVDIAKNFTKDSIPVKLIGMNSDIMSEYLEYVGDSLSNMLGYKKIYNTKNPFKFMETIGLSGKANFFESRPTEYQNPHIMNKSKGKLSVKETDIANFDF